MSDIYDSPLGDDQQEGEGQAKEMPKPKTSTSRPANEARGADRKRNRETSKEKGTKSKRREKPKTRLRRGASPAIPDERACLAALGQLPGLIVTGVITTQQANAIRGVHKTILDEHHRKSSDHQQAQLSDEQVDKLATMDPMVVNMLEPLLTDEQLDMLIQTHAEAEVDEEPESQDGDGQA